jgi:hypothetical protein
MNIGFSTCLYKMINLEEPVTNVCLNVDKTA